MFHITLKSKSKASFPQIMSGWVFLAPVDASICYTTFQIHELSYGNFVWIHAYNWFYKWILRFWQIDHCLLSCKYGFTQYRQAARTPFLRFSKTASNKKSSTVIRMLNSLKKIGKKKEKFPISFGWNSVQNLILTFHIWR